jgi:hypothetical protein
MMMAIWNVGFETQEIQTKSLQMTWFYKKVSFFWPLRFHINKLNVRISNSDHIITLLVLVVALIVELLQPVFYLVTDWALVSVACLYVKRCRFGQPTAFVTVKFIGVL